MPARDPITMPAMTPALIVLVIMFWVFVMAVGMVRGSVVGVAVYAVG